jgi:hypothetical protein
MPIDIPRIHCRCGFHVCACARYRHVTHSATRERVLLTLVFRARLSVDVLSSLPFIANWATPLALLPSVGQDAKSCKVVGNKPLWNQSQQGLQDQNEKQTCQRQSPTTYHIVRLGIMDVVCGLLGRRMSKAMPLPMPPEDPVTTAHTLVLHAESKS